MPGKTEMVPALAHSSHVRQRSSWDCGVSCVLMLLSEEVRRAALRDMTQICAEEGFGHRTWTIDLAFLLKRFNIDHCLYTVNMDVNEDHRSQRFYKNIIEKDADRVRAKLRSAASLGLRCEQKALPLGEVLRHARRLPAVVLVHGGRLRCRWCAQKDLGELIRVCLSDSYKGHYIVVCGEWRGRVLYRDPARTAPLCCASAAQLRRARTPHTDYDVLLVYPTDGNDHSSSSP